MQEQMNSMNDSGEFQDIESNYSGRLSHFSTQPVMIPSSRSLLSCDKRLPLDTWNQSGLQETFLEINYLRLIHPEMILKEFNQTTCKAGRTKTIHTIEDRQNQCTIPMPTFATRPSTTSSHYRWNNRRTASSDFEDSKYRNCNSTNCQTHNRFWCGSSVQKPSDFLARGWSPQGMGRTGGGGLVRVPNLRVCKHPCSLEGGTRMEGRANSRPALLPSSRRGNTSSVSQSRENWAARKGEWSPRGAGTTVFTYSRPSQP